MTDLQCRQSGVFVARVVRSRPPCRGHFEITLSLDRFPPARPGQFVQLRCHTSTPFAEHSSSAGRQAGSTVGTQFDHPPVLRRPFSIAGLRRTGERCEIDVLGRIVGSGTAWLAKLSSNDALDILGPLGRGFSMPPAGKHALLVAGGIGLPPIRWLGEELSRAAVSCTSICGARTRELLPVKLIEEPSTDGAFTSCVEAFARDGIPTSITTDDGTCGLRGRVTDRLAKYLEDCEDHCTTQVYACGPEPMLRAVGTLCVSRGVSCELALERMMGCGIGTCQSCVVRVVDEVSKQGWRYALCCSEGPVFDAARVVWD